MIEYEFKTEDGEAIDRLFDAGKAPSMIEEKGKIYWRTFRMGITAKKTVHNLASKALPLNWRYADKVNDKGEPVFTSRQHIRECVDRANDHGEGVTYDD